MSNIPTRLEARNVRLADHAFLDSLRRAGFVWQGHLSDHLVMIIAVAKGREWTAYYETPQSIRIGGQGFATTVVDHGTKLPEAVARDLFAPHVRSGLEWRA